MQELFPQATHRVGIYYYPKYLSSIRTLEKWIKMLVAVIQSQLLGVISKSDSLN